MEPGTARYDVSAHLHILRRLAHRREHGGRVQPQPLLCMRGGSVKKNFPRQARPGAQYAPRTAAMSCCRLLQAHTPLLHRLRLIRTSSNSVRNRSPAVLLRRPLAVLHDRDICARRAGGQRGTRFRGPGQRGPSGRPPGRACGPAQQVPLGPRARPHPPPARDAGARATAPRPLTPCFAAGLSVRWPALHGPYASGRALLN